MARIRTIKPEFWSDEKLSECSLSARLLFIGLISFADDEGRMEYSPARIRMQIFPCGSVKAGELTKWMGELSERSLIRIYVIDDKQFLDIPKFSKHQRINRPTASRIPEHSGNAHGILSERSLTEGKGREGKGTGKELEGRGESPAAPFAPQSVQGLDLPSWTKWIAYRSSIKKPIKPASMQAAAEEMAKLGTEQGAYVQHSIANGYTGLYGPKTNGTAPPPSGPKPTPQWVIDLQREEEEKLRATQ